MEPTMDSIVTLVTNAGVSIGVLVYFMYRDFKFMDTLSKTLTTLVDTVNTLKEIVKENTENDN